MATVVFKYDSESAVLLEKALGSVGSRGSLRSSLTSFAVVLASPGFADKASPFHSARIQLLSRAKYSVCSVRICAP